MRQKPQLSPRGVKLARVAGLTLLFLLLNASTWWSFTLINDEAVTALGAQRWLRGEWPYRDWNSRHTPGSYVLTAAWMLIWGEGKTAVRSLALLLGVLQSLLLYDLAEPLRGRARWLPSVAWSAGGMQLFPILSYHWLAVLAFCCTVRSVREWLRAPKLPVQAALVGVSVALCCWCLQSEGLAAVALVAGVGVAVRPRGWVGVLLGFAVASALLWLPFLPSWSEVLEQNFSAMDRHLAFNRFPFSLRQLQPWWLSLQGSSPGGDPLGWSFALASWGAALWRYAAFYPLLLAASLRAWKQGDRDRGLLCWAAICLTLANANRQTMEYLSFPGAVWLLVALGEVARWDRRGRLAGALTAALVLQGALFQLVGWRDARFPIAAPAGLFWSDDPAAAEIYNQLGGWIQREGLRGQPVLCVPYQPCLYSLWGVVNPLREPVLLPISYSAEEVAAAMARRDRPGHEVLWQIFTPLSPDAMAAVYNVQPEQFALLQTALLQRLAAGFQVSERFRGAVLLKRAGDSRPPAGSAGR